MLVARGVHLLGAGAVGRAWLRMLPAGHLRLVGVTDTSGTVSDDRGLSAGEIAAHKERGGALTQLPGALPRPNEREPSPSAQLIADATPTELARGEADAARIWRWLQRGQAVALASKHAVAADPSLLLSDKVGINAVLGGTGAMLQAELPLLRERWRGLALAGSISSTVVLEAIEQGSTLAEGLARAAALGVLEPDPELDLCGADAATKLAIVAGALLGRAFPPQDLAAEHLRAVDPELIRARARRGQTTRLIGRAAPDQPPQMRWEAVDRSDPLALGPAEVVYTYTLDDATMRVHRGAGLGAEGTASALHQDIERLLAG